MDYFRIEKSDSWERRRRGFIKRLAYAFDHLDEVLVSEEVSAILELVEHKEMHIYAPRPRPCDLGYTVLIEGRPPVLERDEALLKALYERYEWAKKRYEKLHCWNNNG